MWDVPVMPKGLKETSSLIAISAKVTETAANTFTSQRVLIVIDSAVRRYPTNMCLLLKQ